MGLGPSDDPRRVEVRRRVASRAERPLVSTPGARVRLVRSGWDGELGRLLVRLHRRGVPVELAEGDDALTLDGEPVTVEELLRGLSGRGGARPS